MSRARTILWFALAMAVPVVSTPLEGVSATIPHRRSRLVVDGSLEDWRSPVFEVRFSRPPTGARSSARVTSRLCWDASQLWAAFEVVDPDVHLPPPGASGAALFQWDSVEVYLDGLGDRAPRMDRDDFQIIVTADGRTAVLEGDPLLAEVEPLSVPKRDRDGITIPASARRTEDGFVVELALPWAAFGIEPTDGTPLALDLAVNDWDTGHGQLPMYAYDLETINAIANKEAAEPGEYDEHGFDGAAADRFASEHYHPWSWSGSADFGHPASWTAVSLVGAPPILERLLERFGVRGLLLLVGSLGLLVTGAALGSRELSHRRQIAGLMRHLAQFEQRPSDATPSTVGEGPEPPTAFADRRPSGPVPLDTLEHRIDGAVRSESTPDPSSPPPELVGRAISLVSASIADPLTPAHLADELHVSLRTLQRELASRLRCTPRELIVAVKMREAKNLLARGWRVQEVAVRVGFDDASHFSRRFKAYVGVPPSELTVRATSDSTAA